MDPRVNLQLRVLRVVIREQLLLEVRFETLRRHGLERVRVEVAAQKRVEFLASERLFQHAQKQIAFLVGRRRRHFFDVAAGEVDQQRGVLAIDAVLLEIEVEVVSSEQGLHLHVLASVEDFVHAAFDVRREAFVQPEVVPAGVGDEIPRPRVRQLVHDDRDERAVAGDENWRHEGESRVLHPAQRKAGGKHEHVESLPTIRPQHRLRGIQHLLQVDELVHGLVDDAGLGVDAGARANRAVFDIADRQREQVRRNRLVHFELADTIRALRLRILRTHHRQQAGGHLHLRRVREAVCGRVLARHPRARVDRLRLRVHVRMLLAQRLMRLEPLHAAGVGGRFVAHGDAPGLRLDRDRERPADQGERVAELPAHLLAAVERHIVDAKRPRVQVHDLGTGLVIEVEGGRARDHLAVEVDREIEVHVFDGHVGELRVRIVFGGGRRREGLIFFAGGCGQEEPGEEGDEKAAHEASLLGNEQPSTIPSGNAISTHALAAKISSCA